MFDLVTIVVRIALYAALVAFIALAAAVVAPIVIRLVRRQAVETPRLDFAKHAAGMLAAAIGIIISVLNLFFPIGTKPKPDFAKAAIESFYASIERSDFPAAYRLIHPRRIEKIHEKLPEFDEKSFERAYATSRHHSGFLIEPVSEDPGIGTRTYKVSFDVEDDVPRNCLFLSRQQLFKDFVAEIPDAATLTRAVEENISTYLVVPPARQGDVADFVQHRPMESLLDPMFISDVGRVLGLVPRESPSTNVLVKRHFELELTMAEDDGQWKILDGLANPKSVAVYGTTVPK